MKATNTAERHLQRRSFKFHGPRDGCEEEEELLLFTFCLSSEGRSSLVLFPCVAVLPFPHGIGGAVIEFGPLTGSVISKATDKSVQVLY